MFTPDPQKILIVDDSKASIQAVGDVLKEYTCMAATTGENALRIANGPKKPDLVLLDVVMDGMDGYEVCKALKKNTETKDIPVIFMSAIDDPDVMEKVFDVGASDFIRKPYLDTELRVRVSNQLRYKKTLDNNAMYLKSIEDIYDTITDSMYYAQKIQQATLPHNSYLEKVMDEYFVIYKPRDIVSGDFYLVHEIEDKLLLVAADCTGHGVPGALMSMMSMALINEMINIEHVYHPEKILNQLRKLIVNTFRNYEEDEISDGLDAAIVLIDSQEDKMYFAGANSPLYIIRRGELIEFKGDRMPVGIYPSQTPFKSTVIHLEPEDCIYLFSDGYADQFGGEANTKLKTVNFKKLLAKYGSYHMHHQKEALNNYFIDWMGYNEQVDDVLLIGYRYKKNN